MAVSVFAVARRNDRGISPDAIFSTILITKTYDLYGVICPSDPCCDQGKCLGTMDANTCLNVCGLTFDHDNTEYWVYDEADVLVGSCVNGVCVPVKIPRVSVDGRVRFELRVRAKHPGPPINTDILPARLNGVTLSLAATSGNHVGSEYEQEHIDAQDIVIDTDPDSPTYDHQMLVLPDPNNLDSGANIILAEMCQ
jgi:hypothetical protein